MTTFFGDIRPIRFEGRDSRNPFSFRHYDPDEIVMGRKLKDQLRFAARRGVVTNAHPARRRNLDAA
jgi:xylose isomerase